MIKITRTFAIELLIKLKYISTKLSTHILLDAFDSETDVLLMQQNTPEKFESEMLQYFKMKYFGVANDYLAYCLNQYLNIQCEIDGLVEALETCPCCTYKTLPTLGEYDICEICHWESDSINPTLDRYSSVNQSCLLDYKEAFKQKIVTPILLKKYVNKT